MLLISYSVLILVGTCSFKMPWDSLLSSHGDRLHHYNTRPSVPLDLTTVSVIPVCEIKILYLVACSQNVAVLLGYALLFTVQLQVIVWIKRATNLADRVLQLLDQELACKPGPKSWETLLLTTWFTTGNAALQIWYVRRTDNIWLQNLPVTSLLSC